MNVRPIPRTALDVSLRLARVPLDTALALLPGNGTGRAATAALVLDRAEATTRAVVGALLRDSVLTDDATQRRGAVDERERALRLRVAAERKTDHADERAEEQSEQAERRREQARERAEARKQQAKKKREASARNAEEIAAKRRQNSRKAAAKTSDAADKRGRRTRLDAVKAEADALRNEEAALTKRNEAQRLRKAAGKAKAVRKRSAR